MIYARQSFHFELSNSKFIGNEYSSSNVLDGIAYIEINKILVDKNVSPLLPDINIMFKTEQIIYT